MKEDLTVQMNQNQTAKDLKISESMRETTNTFGPGETKEEALKRK